MKNRAGDKIQEEHSLFPPLSFKTIPQRPFPSVILKKAVGLNCGNGWLLNGGAYQWMIGLDLSSRLAMLLENRFEVLNQGLVAGRAIFDGILNIIFSLNPIF